MKSLWYKFLYGRNTKSVNGKADPRDWEVRDDMIPASTTESRAAEKGIRMDSFTRRGMTLPVQNQGRTNTCVGQSVKIAMQDTNSHRKSGEVSPMYPYYWAQRMDQWEGENYEGTSVSAGCKALLEKGNVLNKVWPNGVKEAPAEIEKLDEAAEPRKIKAYYRISRSDKDLVNKMKGLLENESLVWSFRVNEHIFKIGSDGIIDSEEYGNSKYTGGGHAVAITGWKYIDGELHWEIQNSWGEGWGDKGFGYFPHKLFISHSLSDVYYLVVGEEVQEEIPVEIEKKTLKKLFWHLGGMVILGLVGWLVKLFG